MQSVRVSERASDTVLFGHAAGLARVSPGQKKSSGQGSHVNAMDPWWGGGWLELDWL